MYTVSLTYPLSRIAYSALAMLCGVLHKAHNSLIITPPLHQRVGATKYKQ